MFKVQVRVAEKTAVELTASEGQNLLALLRSAGVSIESPCGGRGTCAKCQVVVRTDGGEPESRLACQVEVHSNLIVELPDGSQGAQILTEGSGPALRPGSAQWSPMVTKQFLQLPAPTITDQANDAERLERSAGGLFVLPELLPDLPEILRRRNFNVTVASSGSNIIAVEAGDTSGECYGMAIDVGTTTMVAYLLDLNSGEQLGVATALNPQRQYGADVINRIDYTSRHPGGLRELANAVRTDINQMIIELCNQNGLSPENIYQVILVGNTVMMHIFAELPVSQIAVSPYVPVVGRHLHFSLKQAGIKGCPTGRATVLPMVSGYIGADTVAAILAAGMTEKSELSLLIDIGTNGEIVLGNRDRLVACSAAAGPAFEGAHIQCGMGGVAGAINSVAMNGGRLTFTTIRDAAPRGICGSGIVDLMALMLNTGILDESGRMKKKSEAIKMGVPADLAGRIGEVDGVPLFELVSEQGKGKGIYFTQEDVREVQLAKGAIAAGIRILAKETGVSLPDIDRIYLAGGLGNYVRRQSAVAIGLIPSPLARRVESIGNAAGTGAKLALISRQYLDRSEEIRNMVEYIELSSRADFQEAFIECMGFSHDGY